MSGDGILVTYDNPISYPQIIASLKRVGRIKYAPTRTTVLLRLRDGKNYRDLRRAVVSNLHPTWGNATYANLESQKAFAYGRMTKFKWRKG